MGLGASREECTRITYIITSGSGGVGDGRHEYKVAVSIEKKKMRI
jgi:hypothetical protein